MSEDVFVGIDVAKDHFDVHILPADEKVCCNMDAKGIKWLISRLKEVSPTLIALESTGGYERDLFIALRVEGLPALLVNPHRARQYARGIGKQAKTDPIDAYTLARFAREIDIKEPHSPTEDKRFLKELSTRRSQLMKLRTQEKNRLQRASSARVKRSVQEVIQALDEQIKQIDKDLDDFIKRNSEWSEKSELLQTIPGVGKTTAFTFIAEMPELGDLSAKQIASLTGVAPFNHDSGKLKGRRMIKGGRSRARKGLYMATVTATWSNSRIKPVYQRLRAGGKSAKVALVVDFLNMVSYS